MSCRGISCAPAAATTADVNEAPFVVTPLTVSMLEESSAGILVYSMEVGDVDAGDVVSVLLWPTNNSALGVAPAFAFNPSTLKLTTLLGGKSFDYDLGVTVISVDFQLNDTRGLWLVPGPLPVNVTLTVNVISAYMCLSHGRRVFAQLGVTAVLRVAAADVNELAIMTSAGNATATENMLYTFHTIVWDDQDAASVHALSIVAGDPLGMFAVCPSRRCTAFSCARVTYTRAALSCLSMRVRFTRPVVPYPQRRC
jgi:hypothetical protein